MAPHSNDTTTMLFNKQQQQYDAMRCTYTEWKRLRSKRLQYVSGAILMAWPLHITSIEHNGLYTSESYILHMGCGCASACFLYSYYVYFLCRASSSQDIHSMALCASFDFHPFFITHSIVATFPFSLACVCHPVHPSNGYAYARAHTHTIIWIIICPVEWMSILWWSVPCWAE